MCYTVLHSITNPLQSLQVKHLKVLQGVTPIKHTFALIYNSLRALLHCYIFPGVTLVTLNQ